MKRRREGKDGEKQVSENEERGGDGEMGMEVKSTFRGRRIFSTGL